MFIKIKPTHFLGSDLFFFFFICCFFIDRVSAGQRWQGLLQEPPALGAPYVLCRTPVPAPALHRFRGRWRLPKDYCRTFDFCLKLEPERSRPGAIVPPSGRTNSRAGADLRRRARLRARPCLANRLDWQNGRTRRPREETAPN